MIVLQYVLTLHLHIIGLNIQGIIPFVLIMRMKKIVTETFIFFLVLMSFRSNQLIYV